MKQQTEDLRKRTLDLAQTKAMGGAEDLQSQAVPVLQIWLASLEEEDLISIVPENLASALWQGFSAAAQKGLNGCRVQPLRYTVGRNESATALLIVNQDMPFLVDSIVMAMRKMRIVSRAVLNAVLSVQRGSDGEITHVESAVTGSDPLESYVLCLLHEELDEHYLSALIDSVRMVAADALAVQGDATALLQKIASVAISATEAAPEGGEVAPFLSWAGHGGLRLFGYAYYHVIPAAAKLVCDTQSRLGVLRDPGHPVYGSCLTGIPEDYATLANQAHALSIVKADAQSTLHQDQQLDFIGVRDLSIDGKILGEHCFVGLFSRVATATPLTQLPFVRERIQQVLSLAGVRQEGFRAEKFLEVLESLPRSEILEASPQWLAQVCGTVVALYKQPCAQVFARRDVYGRHLNVLIYMPRERYSVSLADALAQSVRNLAGAVDVVAQPLLSDGPLMRIYLSAKVTRPQPNLESDICQPLLEAIDGWQTVFDTLVDDTEDALLRIYLRKLCALLPAEYQSVTSPYTAFRDLVVSLESRRSARIKVHIEIGWREVVTIRLLSVNSAPSLSLIFPALHNAGVVVDREKTHVLHMQEHGQDLRLYITCLSVDAQSAAKLIQPDVIVAAQELFESLFNSEVEDGRMNGLAVEAGLRQKEVQLIRGYASYWRQAGCRFSLRYMADCLRKQPSIIKNLIDSYLMRFDPTLTSEQRAMGTASLLNLKQNVADINHADTEDILRGLVDLMLATLRTSYFQDAQADGTIIFKFDCSQLALLPEPRPYREIYVFSRRFEGVHLRGGPVARGGLRWSDRMEDYRTEVMGLVKAQMVKNAVIVPVGAKGGFICKMMPKSATREAIALEGESVYRLYIAGLLDITDNRVGDDIVSPQQTVCYDDADHYLVVAADKGTASFSDIANSIAVKRGFWLGDAFASGGSNGYDHKKLGITAKGAWEAVKRHFYEIDHDINTTPITMVGIGDMSGDVFGNGVLLSRQLKLIAAFDHRHIFIDPTPDVEVSFKERQRLFGLPRSSWDDYDKSLISKGGGVWPRNVRSIELSDQARAALSTEATTMMPEQLLRIILLAPVDLFYNGGIGTYIKAYSESNAQVKDFSNDQIRVNGRELRCKVVAEGGNLGATQNGRIEFALNGGRIFTDAIDNSAGVDCSDHEVNIKIWLDTEVNAGKLNEVDRNRILNEITEHIEKLVLQDNTLQTHLLTRETQAQTDVATRAGYAALIADLEEKGVISREVEQLPTASELAHRNIDGGGLTAPELAVVIAHVKNRYKRILATLPLLDYSWAATLLTPYFPQALVKTRDPLSHPLANAILATVLANESINRCGPLLIADLSRKHGVDEGEVIFAWAQSWATLNLASLFMKLDAQALKIPCQESKHLDERTRVMQKAVIDAMLGTSAQLMKVSDGFNELSAIFSDPDTTRNLMPTANPSAVEPQGDYEQARLNVEAIAEMADFLFAALAVVRPDNLSLSTFLQIGTNLRRHVGIDELERVLMQSSTDAKQEPLCVHALQVLRRTQQMLLTQVLQQLPSGASASMINGVIMSGVKRMKHNGSVIANAAQTNLEQTVLDVWRLSESAMLAIGDI